MRKYIKLLVIILYTSFISCGIITAVYWIMNPELSQMQVFLKFWYWIVLNIVFALFVMRLEWNEPSNNFFK